ncbi:hypothetical protein ACUWC2_27055, partial [Klebsiella pneumoniae]
AQIREILISESAWEEMTCLFAPSLALLIVALSGGLWFLLNTMQSNLAETVIHWHKFFTTFIEVYFYAHGAMGVLHILIEKYKSRSVNLSD